MQGRKLRVGLIGLGGVAEVHLEAYKSLDLIEVVAGAEMRPDRLAGMAALHGFKPYDDYRRMLREERLDIACVLTPCATHEAVVVDCAAAGVHVLCEKPISLSLASVERMIAACATAGVELFYGSSYRFLPALRKARELIAEGVIGQVALLREGSVGGRGKGVQRPLSPAHYPIGGPGGSGMGLVDHGIHLIDIFSWITGSRIVRVFGRGNISGQPLTTEYAILHLENGAVGELIYNDGTFGIELPNEGAFSWGGAWDANGNLLPPGQWQAQPGFIAVHGAKGALRIFHYCNMLYLINDTGVQQVKVEDHAMPGNFSAQMAAFARNILEGKPAETPAEAGRAALGVLLAVYESAEKGCAAECA